MKPLSKRPRRLPVLAALLMGMAAAAIHFYRDCPLFTTSLRLTADVTSKMKSQGKELKKLVKKIESDVTKLKGYREEYSKATTDEEKEKVAANFKKRRDKLSTRKKTLETAMKKLKDAYRSAKSATGSMKSKQKKKANKSLTKAKKILKKCEDFLKQYEDIVKDLE